MEDRKPLLGFYRASSTDEQLLQSPAEQQLQQPNWAGVAEENIHDDQENAADYRQYEAPQDSSMQQQLQHAAYFAGQEPSCSYMPTYPPFDQAHQFDWNSGYPMSFASFFPTFPMEFAAPDVQQQQQPATCGCEATRLLQQLLQLQPGLAPLVQQLQQQQPSPPTPFPTPGSFPALPSPMEQQPPACLQQQQLQLQHSPSDSIEEEIENVNTSGVMTPDYPFHFNSVESETTPVPSKAKKRPLTPFHRVRASAAPVPANRTLQFRERMKPKTHENSSCAHCGTRETSLWRRNARGETECNPCNLFERKNGFPRPLNMCTQKKILSRKRVRKCPK